MMTASRLGTVAAAIAGLIAGVVFAAAMAAQGTDVPPWGLFGTVLQGAGLIVHLILAPLVGVGFSFLVLYTPRGPSQPVVDAALGGRGSMGRVSPTAGPDVGAGALDPARHSGPVVPDPVKWVRDGTVGGGSCVSPLTDRRRSLRQHIRSCTGMIRLLTMSLYSRCKGDERGGHRKGHPTEEH